MHKNFGGSLYEIEDIKTEVVFIEEAVNLMRIALFQVRGLFSEVSKLSRLPMVSPASCYKAEKASVPRDGYKYLL